MRKEIQKYPYNSQIVDKNEIFLSDQICEQVVKITYKNVKIFGTFKDKIINRKKEISVSAVFIFVTFFGMPNESRAMGLPPRLLRCPEIHRPVSQHFDHHAPVVNLRLDQISFVESSQLPVWVFMMDERFVRNPEISKIIKEIRGGSLKTALIGNLIFLAIIYGVWVLTHISPPDITHAFVTSQQSPGWGLYDPPGLVRPGDCEIQLNAGLPSQSLKTAEGRNQPNIKDRRFLVKSRPKLIMRRGQAKFKTKDHGALVGLPYSIKKNGATSTLKTEKNVDKFMDGVQEIVYHPDSVWFEEATYQGGTPIEVDSINIYHEDYNRIAIFRRSTGEFITLCEPSGDEIADLKENANFGGQDKWFSSIPKNMPPQKEFVSDFTPVDSFESDIMNSMDENSCPSQGFTPRNSFESDILGITPVDPDWQI